MVVMFTAHLCVFVAVMRCRITVTLCFVCLCFIRTYFGPEDGDGEEGRTAVLYENVYGLQTFLHLQNEVRLMDPKIIKFCHLFTIRSFETCM